MVNKVKKGSIVYFQCGVCKLGYRDERTARKCETWCGRHKSCNLEIIKKAVKL